MNRVYLDNAATTLPDAEVTETMGRVMREYYGNPSSVHQTGAASRDLIEDSRRSIAKILHAQSSEIFFTSGATESINTILHGAVDSLNIKHIITSQLEHPAVIETVNLLQKTHNISLSFVKFNADGVIDLEHLRSLTFHQPRALICLMHANNELGNLLPIKKVHEIAKESNSYFFSDTVQSIGKFEMDFSAGIFDFAVGSAHKFHGPKGIGFMYIKSGIKINPRQSGGPQERNMRAGTENIAAIAGMETALKNSYKSLSENCTKINFLKQHFINRVKNELPNVAFNGQVDGIYTILNLSFPKSRYNKMLIFNLDIEGFAVSGGSACSSGVMNISHVIKALGKADDFIPVRVSFSKHNTVNEIDSLIDVLKKY